MFWVTRHLFNFVFGEMATLNVDIKILLFFTNVPVVVMLRYSPEMKILSVSAAFAPTFKA